LSNSLSEVPERLQDKVTLVLGSLSEALEKIHQNGHLKLYVDGGQVIHSFMKEDLIDEMFITTVPVVLGGGIPLFRDLPTRLEFQHVKSESFFGFYVQDHYKRLRK
ncbi:MAG: dihydrofolate reductase, partial [Flavobacteriales bacterium]|nr:dihydrofolate reductase [Flavobacteriales bacterium]